MQGILYASMLFVDVYAMLKYGLITTVLRVDGMGVTRVWQVIVVNRRLKYFTITLWFVREKYFTHPLRIAYFNSPLSI